MSNQPNNQLKNQTSPKTGHTKKQSKDMQAKAFRIALEMIAVFGIPAVVALVADRRLEGTFGSWITYALLGLAFVISWVIVYVRVRSFGRQFENDTSDDDDKANTP
jgi:F0F1-type ATP synthase assembly protein I